LSRVLGLGFDIFDDGVDEGCFEPAKSIRIKRANCYSAITVIQIAT
jgi:hypothetical protein